MHRLSSDQQAITRVKLTLVERGRAKVNAHGLMDPTIQATGSTIRDMDKVSSSTPLEILTMANGPTARNMEKDFRISPMTQESLDVGKMVFCMELDPFSSTERKDR